MRHSRMTRTPVLIVGAGPTGLVLALWLAELGVAVRIIDKLDTPAPFSRALGVHARTLEFYRQIGLADSVVQSGVIAGAINLWLRGRPVARLGFENIGTGLSPYPFILDLAQNEHERLLTAELRSRGVEVERPTELVGIEQTHGEARATLRHADGSEEICVARYLAGCDGAHSAVREQQAVGFPGGTYSHLFYVADIDARGPATNGELHVDLDEADLLAVFPMKGAGHVRLVGTVRDDAARAGGELSFADVGQRVIHQLGLTVETINWFSPYRVHHRVAASFRSGNTFLLGDAAHIHSPVGAQGMNTGIGDAVNLAWKLAAVLRGSAPESLLDTYEPERMAFARRLVATTDRAFTIVTKSGGVASYVRREVVPVIAPLLMRLRAVRRLVFRTVSQISVNYRRSSLSAGRAAHGNARPGDRLPWVRSGDGLDNFGLDNFAPLRSLAWQAHVYGAVASPISETCDALRLPLHRFAWNDGMQTVGLARDALYVIRPDAYIAMIDPTPDARRLQDYFVTRGLRAEATR